MEDSSLLDDIADLAVCDALASSLTLDFERWPGKETNPDWNQRIEQNSLQGEGTKGSLPEILISSPNGEELDYREKFAESTVAGASAGYKAPYYTQKKGELVPGLLREIPLRTTCDYNDTIYNQGDQQNMNSRQTSSPESVEYETSDEETYAYGNEHYGSESNSYKNHHVLSDEALDGELCDHCADGSCIYDPQRHNDYHYFETKNVIRVPALRAPLPMCSSDTDVSVSSSGSGQCTPATLAGIPSASISDSILIYSSTSDPNQGENTSSTQKDSCRCCENTKTNVDQKKSLSLDELSHNKTEPRRNSHPHLSVSYDIRSLPVSKEQLKYGQARAVGRSPLTKAEIIDKLKDLLFRVRQVERHHDDQLEQAYHKGLEYYSQRYNVTANAFAVQSEEMGRTKKDRDNLAAYIESREEAWHEERGSYQQEILKLRNSFNVEMFNQLQSDWPAWYTSVIRSNEDLDAADTVSISAQSKIAELKLAMVTQQRYILALEERLREYQEYLYVTGQVQPTSGKTKNEGKLFDLPFRAESENDKFSTMTDILLCDRTAYSPGGATHLRSPAGLMDQRDYNIHHRERDAPVYLCQSVDNYPSDGTKLDDHLGKFMTKSSGKGQGIKLDDQTVTDIPYIRGFINEDVAREITLKQTAEEIKQLVNDIRKARFMELEMEVKR